MRLSDTAMTQNYRFRRGKMSENCEIHHFST
jgi:hypothetical protein